MPVHVVFETMPDLAVVELVTVPVPAAIIQLLPSLITSILSLFFKLFVLAPSIVWPEVVATVTTPLPLFLIT